MLTAVERELSRAGLLFELSSKIGAAFSSSIKLGPAGYVDDVVQPLIAPASVIVEKMRLCAGIYNEMFSRYGLTINFKKGKTEALFRFVGEGAKSSRHKLFFEDQGQISVQSRGKSFALAATLAYKHVGTITCSTDTMQPEITAKLSAMNGTFRQLKPTFLNRSSVPVEKRLLLCRSILFSKSLFQASTWPTLYTAELARVHKAIMKIYSSIYAAGSDERVSHANISKNDIFIAPAIVIVFLRLSLFVRVCLRAPHHLFATLSQDMGTSRSWMQSVATDLKFVSTISYSF